MASDVVRTQKESTRPRLCKDTRRVDRVMAVVSLLEACCVDARSRGHSDSK